jgi:hypothetical protein
MCDDVAAAGMIVTLEHQRLSFVARAARIAARRGPESLVTSCASAEREHVGLSTVSSPAATATQLPGSSGPVCASAALLWHAIERQVPRSRASGIKRGRP